MKEESELKRRCGMKPYSMDLRQRIAAAVDHGDGSFRQIARRFRVSLSFIARLLRRRRQAGTLEPKPHGGGLPPALDPIPSNRLVEKEASSQDGFATTLFWSGGCDYRHQQGGRRLRELAHS